MSKRRRSTHIQDEQVFDEPNAQPDNAGDTNGLEYELRGTPEGNGFTYIEDDVYQDGEGDEPDTVQLDAEIDAGDDEQFKANEIMRVSFGNAVAVVTDDGRVTIDARAKEAVSYIVSDTNDAFKKNFDIEPIRDPSQLPQVFNDRGVQLPAGIGVVVGPASVGKTPVLKWLVAASNHRSAGSAHLIRFGEPLPGYLTREADAVMALTELLLSPRVSIIAIDSIKDLLASMGGGLMARGVPRELFRMLSQWGSVAASLGKLIIVPLNISTDNEDALAEVESAVLSNATFAALAQPLLSQANKFTFTTSARQGEGKRRLLGRWTLSFDADGIPSISAGNRETETVAPASVETNITLTQYSVGRALARALNHDKE